MMTREEQLRGISGRWPRWGFRRAQATLLTQRWQVESQAGAAAVARRGATGSAASPKRRRLGESTVPADRPNQVWALDFMFDTTSDGRPFKVLSMCDEFTKECLQGPLGRSITAADVVAALDRAARLRGFPEQIRCDKGPEFVARAIRDWCRQTGAKTSYIEPGSPCQNPYVESLNSRARDERFAREIFDSILEARVLYADWCWSYNHLRPHSAPNYQPPAALAKAFRRQ